MELKAKIKNSILKIKNLKIDSPFFKINSYGEVYFHKNHSISCFLKTKIAILRLCNRIINFSFKSNLNAYNKLTFKLKTEDLYKIEIHGKVLLNSLDYPFLIKLKSKNLFWSIKEDYTLKVNNLHGVLKGRINNYFLSLKNIVTLQGLPSIFINFQVQGNFKNIFLKKIKFFPIKQTKFHKKIINTKNNIKYYQYILKLIGKINIAGKSDNNIYNIDIPKINLNGNIMKKKFSILGSLYYKNFNCIEIPRINLFLGSNKLHLKGSLGKYYNICSSFYAYNLNYFFPDLTGKIKGKVNFYGHDFFPIITGKILAENLEWNDIYLKNIKILTEMNMNNTFSEKTLIDAQKIHFNNLHINALHIQTDSNNDKQNFSFLLKSHKLYINFIINGVFNKKTGNWYGFFKKMDVRTFWGRVNANKNSVIHYYDFNNTSNFYRKNIQKKCIISSFLHNIKMSLFNILNSSDLSFKSELFINSQLQWTLGKKMSNGKIILIGQHKKLEKKINKKTLIENIEYSKILINLIDNNFESQWIIKKVKNSLQKRSIIGYLNIMDCYNKKNMKGKFTIYDFPFSFLNFFTTNFKEANGIFQSKIKFFGTLYQPKVSADVSFQNIFIKSDNILKYITLFFPYFSGKIDSIKINQEIIMEKGNILFTLNSFLKNPFNKEWRLTFNSKKISVLIFPKIKIKFSSQLNLHYLFEKYDLIGYIKFALFYFKINEKNFIF